MSPLHQMTSQGASIHIWASDILLVKRVPCTLCAALRGQLVSMLQRILLVWKGVIQPSSRQIGCDSSSESATQERVLLTCQTSTRPSISAHHWLHLTFYRCIHIWDGVAVTHWPAIPSKKVVTCRIASSWASRWPLLQSPVKVLPMIGMFTEAQQRTGQSSSLGSIS